MDARKYLPEKKPSEYLSAKELIDAGTGKIGTEWTLKVKDVQARELKDFNSEAMKQKLVLYFQGKEKGMVLNATNQELLIDLFGEETDDWIGQSIRLLIHATDKGPGFCVKPCRQSSRPSAALPETVRPAPAPVQVPADRAPMGDEIPF